MRRLAAALALAALLPAGGRAAVLERVEVVGGVAPAVRLFLSAPTMAVAQRLGAAADARRRLYLDLPATRGPGVPAVVRGLGPVLRVRLGQFDARTLRVVMDLADDVPFTQTAREGMITFVFASGPAAHAEVVAPMAGEPPEASMVPAAVEAPPSGVPAAEGERAEPETRPGSPTPETRAEPTARAPEPSTDAIGPAVEPRTDTIAPAAELSIKDRVPEPEARKDSAAHAAEPPPEFAGSEPESHADAGDREPDLAPDAAPSSPPEIVPAPHAARPTEPEGRPLVVIDPGHGGHDPGAAGIGGIAEKDVVLDIARRLADKLTDRLGVSVLLTRTDDSYVPIERRIAAASTGAALFVSLHANACDSPAARGLEVFYGGGGVRPASTGGANRLAALLGQSLGRALDAAVGGVRGDARPGMFAVLARNAVPGALVEIGYLTHPGDAARACDISYQEMLSEALVDGIARFLRDSAQGL